MGLTTSKSAGGGGGGGGETTLSSAIDSKRATETGSVTIQVAGKSINSFSRRRPHLVRTSPTTTPTAIAGSSPTGYPYVFLYLDRPAAAADVVTAEFVFRLLDGNGEMVRMKIPPSPVTFSFVHGYKQTLGLRKIHQEEQDGELVVVISKTRRCNIAVVTSARHCRHEAACIVVVVVDDCGGLVVVPPPDLHRHLGDLLASGLGSEQTCISWSVASCSGHIGTCSPHIDGSCSSHFSG
uniref:Uncharacterized protein n=1 Tax=Oryza glumipatula TaxID=40148 RepID=A0A0E0BM69_9ORYZ